MLPSFKYRIKMKEEIKISESKLISDLEKFSTTRPDRVWFNLEDISLASGIDKKELFYYLEHVDSDIIIKNFKGKYSTRDIYEKRGDFFLKFFDSWTRRYN